MRVVPEQKTITGNVTAVLRGVTRDADSVGLDLGPTLTVDSVRDDGGPLQYTRSATRLLVSLRTALKPGRRASIAIFYHGTPGEAVTFDAHAGAPLVFTYGMPYSARDWWPSRDSPADKADSADIEITAPIGLISASNGRWLSRVDNGDSTATTTWSVRYPVYPDVVSLAIGRYVTLDTLYRAPGGITVPLRFFVFPDDTAHAHSDLFVLPSILTFFETRLGEYPFRREKYGVAEMTLASFREHQTLPSYGQALLTGDHHNEWILAHELAHQWFGNSLTVANWSDVWLNESFATYAAWMWIEQSQGHAAYAKLVAQRMATPFTGSIYLSDSADVAHMFTPVTFLKGAIVLHMLRHVMGDEHFFHALARYVADHRYRNVTTADAEAAFEREYGASLGWFFAEWIQGSGAPRYDATYTQQRAKGHFSVAVEVKQTQDGPAFTMPLDIVVQSAKGQRTQRLYDRAKLEHLRFDSPDSVTSVAVDPGGWVLVQH